MARILLVVFLMLRPPIATQAGEKTAASGMTLVAFGDSTTAVRKGVTVYAEILKKDLRFEGHEVTIVNAGVGGNTTAQALKRFDADVLAKNPKVAVVMFGINDAAVDVWKKPPATAPRVPLADYTANLAAMVGKLKERGTRVVLMTSNPLGWSDVTKKLYAQPPYRPDDPDGFNILLRDYAQAVRQLARATGCGLVDVEAAFREKEATPGKLSPDGMHPGDRGHQIIAELLIAHLAEADPRFTRRPFSVWHRSGELTEMHPRATDITHDTPHPAVLGPALVKLGDGAVMSVYSTPTSYAGKPGECFIAGRVTRDGGRTWEPERELTRLPDGRAAHPTVHRTRDGTLHVFFLGYVKFQWDPPHVNPTPECRSDLWTSRSRDDGKTWSPPQRIFQGYTGSTNGAEETRDGHLVVPFSHYVSNPGRLVSRTVVSRDGGQTWKESTPVDIGGAGDHDGAVEPCVIELRDGRLWMLIRTPRKLFWEAFSTDGGLSWGEARPTAIESSHSPGHVIRLHDGRLALAWNPRSRSELHLALSADEGRTWSPSVAVVRGTGTYAFLLQNTPGEIWLGFMDSHKGWGTAPRARHLKIALDAVFQPKG